MATMPDTQSVLHLLVVKTGGLTSDFFLGFRAGAKNPTHSAWRSFDRDEDILVTERRLPHWAQAYTLCFITWRTWDSIPKPILRRWLKERWEWLLAHGIDTNRPIGDSTSSDFP